MNEIIRLGITFTIIIILGWLMNIYFDEGGPGGGGPGTV